MNLLFIQTIASIVLLADSMYLIQDSGKFSSLERIEDSPILESAPSKKVKKTVAVKDKSQLWSSGVIPYEFENIFTGAQIRVIKLGMRMWEESTCIKFVEKDPSTSDFIAITKGICGCCYIENIRRNEGRSELSFDDGCEKIPIVLHELGHVVGFYHEHEHPDRDVFVRINEHNVERGYRTEFGKFERHQVDTLGLPYDYRSIMHYPKDAFARYDFMETIVPRQDDNGTIPTIGNKFRLSDYDIAATNRLYNCPTCGGFLTHTSGNIELPETNNGHCQWRIRAAQGERIYLGIQSLDIKSTDCQNEYLEVQNGFDTLNSPIFDRFCGQKHGYGISVSGSMIISYFKADNSNTTSEFRAAYTKICNVDLHVTSDSPTFLESPNYPKNYEPYKDCLWNLIAPVHHRIKIAFDFFSLEDSQDCAKDYLRIGDGYGLDSPIIGTFCGSRSPWTVISKENYAFIRFVSDGNNETAGFSASIVAITDN